MTNEQRIVKKSNSIVSSRMKNFSFIQTKIFNLAISELKPETKPEDVLTFHSIDVLKIIGLGEKNHEELKKATLNMIRGVEIKKPNGDIHQVPIFNEIAYLKGGIITIQFHEKVLPLLIQAKIEYTKYYFENIQRLKSMYSIRIYELCKQYQNTENGYRDFLVDDLRYILDVSKKSYPKYSNFKQKVIMVAIPEISEKTDLIVNFEEIKKGRSVNKIRFFITPKNQKKIENTNVIQTSISEEKEELTPAGSKLIKDYLISPKIASELQVLATSDNHLLYAINKISERLDYQIKQGNKPNNIPKYVEISLRELIPTLLISGTVEKEIEEKEKKEIENKLKQEQIKKEKEQKELENKRLDEAFQNFINLHDEEREEIVNLILGNDIIAMDSYKKNGLNSKVLRSHFNNYIKSSWKNA